MPKPRYEIHFDGACKGNPGPGGWGATVTGDTLRKTIRERRPLGECTSNLAEYAGLIGGFRALMRHLDERGEDSRNVEVTVKGDSQLIIQMLHRNKVQSKRLKPWHWVATGLDVLFGEVYYKHIPRSQNEEADSLAQSAAKPSRDEALEHGAVYYPTLAGCAQVTLPVHGKTPDMHDPVLSSSDLLTSSPNQRCMIDARYLSSLPDHGKDCFEQALDDPDPISFVVGKVRMNVLGVYNTSVDYQMGPMSPVNKATISFLVVDRLPVPAHLGSRPMDPFGSTMNVFAPFEEEYIEEPYCDHPYWNTNVIFMPWM